MTGSLLIRGGTIVTMNPERDVIEDGAVLSRDGRIVYVGPSAGAPAGAADRVIDAAGKAVLPGLINAHTHLCMIFGRTLAVERDLMSWLGIEMPLLRALVDEALYLAELLGAAENLKNGNTTLVENIFLPRQGVLAPEDAAFRALRDSGARGMVARAYHGRNFAPDFIETTDEQAERVAALAETWHGAEGGRLGLSIGPLLPWIVDEAQLRETRRLADSLGIALHLHVAESPDFNRMIAEHFGRPIRNVELLYENDCLGPTTQVVAVADVNQREIELLAETGTSVVFDPPTRLYWGTGFPAIRPFLDAGLTCALGSNGPAANCGQDIFESMKYACATAKTAAGAPDALGCRRALAMATIEGARALGLDGEIGSLEAGKRADVITIDLAQPHLTPAFDLEAALVYSARGKDVSDVVVDGALVMRDRRLLTIDEPAMLAAAREAAVSTIRRAGLDPAQYRNVESHAHAA